MKAKGLCSLTDRVQNLVMEDEYAGSSGILVIMG
jgi:hypothetical protein